MAEDDDFVEILPTRPARGVYPPAEMLCMTAGRAGNWRLVFLVRLDNLDAEARRIITTGRRFSVAISDTLRSLRLKASMTGAFEFRNVKAATKSQTWRLSCPVPRSKVFAPRNTRVAIDLDVIADVNALIIDLPDCFIAKAAPPIVRKAPVDMNAALTGDPSPGRGRA
jgi:hypothetical protein